MRLTLAEYRKSMTDEEFEATLAAAVCDGVCHALCTEHCEVEPDGTCPHGNPSLLLALDLI